ncbi:putative adenosine kinase [Clavispora lusitaniae]|uniref:Adenosine kinase n=1 Tax=Clavispora lusitaniae TaxID=36911 RepID=A0ACD0WC72_CLALS|nr:adenosine kinase [Clavispora lusitaniae]QFZ25047.1 putative adenosine kinase [Clavispora lusitaniae]QFZ31650.1 putative adenosine kinase [Clavispora lusitaniae]QFZ37318.1 putative adenosine kinase [Clavispora lusitaniae]QFZ43002.1 putative adenosine kinase [Clavispora lusitaniae]
MSYPLVCLGNPLLDLQVDVDAAYLEKYSLNDNEPILAEEKHMPIYDEVLKMDGLKLIAGGAAQNTARGAQYILPPNSVVYFGSTGNDVYAEKLKEANAQYGLRTEYQVQESTATGKCAALITGKNRALVTDLAAANLFTPSHLQKPENWALVENARYFYIGGFHLTASPEAIETLGKHAAANNKVFAMNLSAPFIPQFFKDPLDKNIPYCDYIIGNETEAAAYSESHDLNTTDIIEIAKSVAKLPKANTQRSRTVVFTQGTQPTITVTYDSEKDSFDVNEYNVRPLASEAIVDTNGAGDAFAAGFMAALVQEKSLAEAVDVGQWAAALSIQQVGPTFPFPKQSYA